MQPGSQSIAAKISDSPIITIVPLRHRDVKMFVFFTIHVSVPYFVLTPVAFIGIPAVILRIVLYPVMT